MAQLICHHLSVGYDSKAVLTDLNFEVKSGEFFCVVGGNGTGKSTTLKLITKILYPDEGTISVEGKISSLLEVGAGFQPDMTGRENVFLYGSILGFSKKEIEEKYDSIVEFSEVEEFMDTAVKNYSSGMKSKLGFSIATIANPDILILDEVLSVGDARFKKKSEAKIMQLMEGGTTVLFVSHSLEQVRRICNKAMILDHGTLKSIGDIDTISAEYTKMIAIPAKPKKKKADAGKKASEKKADEEKAADKKEK